MVFIRSLFLVVLVSASGVATSFAQTGNADYMLAPGDVINVQVFNEPALSVQSVRIPGNGLIAYPLLGRIDTENHSVATLEKHITALLLNGYLKSPEVSITVSSYRPYFVKGDVEEPGQHPFAEGMTLEKALSVAGSAAGLQEGTAITVSRFNGQTIQVENGAFPIEPGDVITVTREAPEAERPVDYVYLYGEVGKPGGYEYRSGLTVERAVAIAGGFTPRASKRKIDISRYTEGDGPNTLDSVELTAELQPGDVVTVGESWF